MKLTDEPTRHARPVALALIPALAAAFLAYFFSAGMVDTRYNKVIMFGDSLTQMAWGPGGTGAALANEYQRRFDVLNRGFSGYNSRWAKEVAPHVLNDTSDAALVTVWFGANDAVLEWKAQHVPVEEFKNNLVDIVSPLLKAKTPVLLLTPPTYCPDMRREDTAKRFPGQEWKPDRSIERTADFAQAVKEVAAQLKVPVVDVHKAFEDFAENMAGEGHRAKGLQPLLTDGLHLTASGYKVVTTAVLETIKSTWPKLDAEKIDRRFPTWDSIDPDNHTKAFAKLAK